MAVEEEGGTRFVAISFSNASRFATDAPSLSSLLPAYGQQSRCYSLPRQQPRRLCSFGIPSSAAILPRLGLSLPFVPNSTRTDLQLSEPVRQRRPLDFLPVSFSLHLSLSLSSRYLELQSSLSLFVARSVFLSHLLARLLAALPRSFAVLFRILLFQLSPLTDIYNAHALFLEPRDPENLQEGRDKGGCGRRGSTRREAIAFTSSAQPRHPSFPSSPFSPPSSFPLFLPSSPLFLLW